MTKRALGLAGMLVMLLLAKMAGAAEAPMTRTEAAAQLATLAQTVLEAKRLPCDGGVRTVAPKGDMQLEVICGYSQAYTLNLTTGSITMEQYP